MSYQDENNQIKQQRALQAVKDQSKSYKNARKVLKNVNRIKNDNWVNANNQAATSALVSMDSAAFGEQMARPKKVAAITSIGSTSSITDGKFAGAVHSRPGTKGAV